MPRGDARASGGPHLAAADTDRVMKRSLDDPYTSSAKARKQGHDDIQMAASTRAGSASKSSIVVEAANWVLSWSCLWVFADR